MPNNPHEALHQIFREDTSLISRLLRRYLKEDVPAPDSAAVLNVDLTEVKPLTRFTDTAIMCQWGGRRHIFIVESQTSEDNKKRVSWPYYISYLHNRYECGITLVVLCPDQTVARWASQPISIGLEGWASMLVRPFSLGPKDVEPLADPDEASQDIVLAVFSVLLHRFDSTANDSLDVLAAALDNIDTETAKELAVFTDAGLGESIAQQIWRDLMNARTYQYQSQIATEYRAEGEAKGRAEGEARGTVRTRSEDVVRILERRGVHVDDASRERILTCGDLPQLDEWFDRAITAEAVSELFS